MITPKVRAVAALLLVWAAPALAQDAPVGPCSPYAGPDGDIPSELPGCLRHHRPRAGSLAEELDFRQRREAAGDEAAPFRRRARARRPLFDEDE